ncbi:MAG: phosphoribulokinase [Gammaproteobacteria bacterium]|nr:phosphoribulokinase [Gammaproteobacteria bacterium]MCW8909689.1 phosphoribulokinase [Gammaproteobacteria bacterium]MCW9004444.1 phosphoribulokinase [Gammaproteobacteria bacterium]MCW9055140.1 phosphoribulokinase [Gammaproteobacteria bacterium]
MVNKHPVIAVTGASGAGTTVVQQAFKEIFRRQNINAAFVHGDSFMKYEMLEMKKHIQLAEQNGKSVSCYGPELNDFDKLEALFKEYKETGKGQTRRVVSSENYKKFNQPAGTFTEWSDIPDNTDLLFYEGMHGGVVSNTWTRRKMSESHNPLVKKERRGKRENTGFDVAQYVDFLIGVVPAINLEWIQKIHLDTNSRKLCPEDTTTTILNRLQDYIHFIVPQFSITDINFQRVPVVDTSNPFIARDVPTESESIVVIRFREPKKYDFPYLLKRINKSFMSRRNTMVIPGGEMKHAMDVICSPMIEACCGRLYKV